ncbi:MAG: DNA-binding protein [Firmicutes bacterium]|nr:DNA-binding protein [Bacillota bacterium]
MIKIGEYNSLTVARKADFGYFLDAKTGKTDDDVLLPNSNTLGRELNVGDEIEVFVYRDSKDRPIATLKKPLAQAYDVAYLKVVSSTPMGAFADFGLERDVFIPMKEQKYTLHEGSSYLLYLYIDKTGRIAATTEVDRALSTESEYKVGDEVTGVVYGFQTNGSVMVAVDCRYRGVILKNEYFTEMKPGFEVKLRVKKIYEDGKLGLTPRGRAVDERTQLEDEIIKYLEKHGGEMPYNDKSSPDDIRRVFNQSKNYFKNALGGLMKKGLITQDEEGTKLKK